MTATSDQQTLTEAQLQVAGSEGPCSGHIVVTAGPPYAGTTTHDGDCCKGTGWVPLLPGLRKPCRKCEGSGMEMRRWRRYRPCQLCGGANVIYSRSWEVPQEERGCGWVPETNGWKAQEAVAEAFGDVIEFYRWPGGGWHCEIRHYLHSLPADPLVEARGETAELAFWRALVAWCRAQQKVHDAVR